jgi:hypothetical protein
MFIYHRNVSVSIVVAIIRKRNNDALTNNIYSFFLEIHTYTYTQTDTHTFAFIYKKEEEEDKDEILDYKFKYESDLLHNISGNVEDGICFVQCVNKRRGKIHTQHF